ncbi:unnamed protein product [Arabidopsis arenosa]|uniref:SWIM-type domain-containing protein n=1 Tax=Arabidopsis arenosa TaxID=38785 RepID=A0A8S1ZC73_ARAAE|nr:unnamed protein product [Arabidopsis arenosa]
MDEGVMILVGSWECKESGEWRFKMSAKKYAKCVDVGEGDTISDVEQKIATAFGVDRKRTKLELSFWFEGGDTVFTQQKMPPVSVDSESSLSKFKKIRVDKGGMNMYLTLVEDDGECANTGGQHAISGPDSNADGDNTEVGAGDMERECIGAGESTQFIPVTFEEEEFLADIYEFEESFKRKKASLDKENAKKRREEELVGELDTGSDGGRWESDSEDSGDYDFDAMSKLIETEYPPDWDPWKTSKEKTITTENARVWGQVDDNAVEDQGEYLMSGESGPQLVEVEVAEMGGRERGTPGCSAGAGSVEMSIQMGQIRMRQIGANTQGTETSDSLIPSWESSCGRRNTGSGRTQTELGLVDVSVTALPRREDASAFDDVEGQGNTEEGLGGRAGEDSPEMSPEMGQRIRRDRETSSQRTETFNTDYGRTTWDTTGRNQMLLEGRPDASAFVEGEREGNLEEEVMGCSGEEESAEMSFQMGQTSSQLTLGENMFTELVGDDLEMIRDAAPFKDNAKGVAQDTANMNLRKAGDSIYIGRIFKNKAELHRALCVYSIKRLFNFRIKASDKMRVIAICHDSKCHWRIYATFHENSENVEIRTATLKHSCDVKSRSKYGMKATQSILGDLLKAKYAHGKKGPRACELPEIVLAELNVTISYMKAWHAKEMAMKRARGSEEDSYKNVVHHFKCEGLAKMVSNAARSYTVGDLRYWFEEIQRRNIECANYLVEIGISHWTLAYFPGMRYNVMSSNISESLNAAMQKAIDFPIVTMVEFIRTMLMRWFCERREVATRTRTRCTPEIEEMLIDHLKEATDCAVIAASEWIYQVNDGFGIVFTVDLQKKTCTCRVFDVLMVPCCHALAAVGIRNVDIYSLVGNYAFVTEWRKLWREHILPPPKEKDTEVPNTISEVVVIPPKTRRPGGRPRTVRIPSQGEQQGASWKKKKPNKCTTCGQDGHNRATCKNPL